jgi:hypothetical protein
MAKDKQLPGQRAEPVTVVRDCIWSHDSPKFFDLSSLREPVPPWSCKNVRGLLHKSAAKSKRRSRFFPSPAAVSETAKAYSRQPDQLPAELVGDAPVERGTRLSSSTEISPSNETNDQDEDLQTAISLWHILSFEARRISGESATTHTAIDCDTDLPYDFGQYEMSAAHDARSQAENEDPAASCVHANSLTGLANDAAGQFGTVCDSAICMNVPVPWYDAGRPLACDQSPAMIPLPDDSWPTLGPLQQCAAQEVSKAAPKTPDATTDDT